MFKHSLLGNVVFSEYAGEECVAILDTETTGLPPEGTVYDIGITFVELKADGSASPVHRHGVLVEEIFTNPKEMRQAFFANKVFSDYSYLLNQSSIQMLPLGMALLELQFIFKKYNVTRIGAYNANFDQRMLRFTLDHLGCGTNTLFRDLEWFDLWQMACSTILQEEGFKEWAVDHGYVSSAGNIQTSAEVVNRYLTNSTFIEDHTALSDSVIEAGIFQALYAKLPIESFSSETMTGKTWQAVNTHATKDWVAKRQRVEATDNV